MNTTRLADVPLVPWRNGGGRTRELLAWPAREEWLVRVSVAEIEADGPFSAFPGVDRAFAVLSGAGVVLALPAGPRRLEAGQSVDFGGEAAPACRLLGGPTRDLNLMVRRGAGRAHLAPAPTHRASRWRGLFADGTLWWTDDPTEPLPPHAGWHLALETA
ncbi:MAG TPA: HutD family protein [Burkholderiaceae bacterium]|nr:HutD family protein [Burkholderiaceae bacterium]